jgi:hypothetical protein
MAIGVNSNVTRQDIASITATTTITKPTGTANTDILIAIFATDSGGNNTQRTVTNPTGWTNIFTEFVAGATNGVSLHGAWAKGDVASLGFTNGATGLQQGVVVVGFTGVDNTTSIDATGTTNSSTGATTDTANAVTIATLNAWELIAFASWNGGTNSATGFTAVQNVASPPAPNADATLLYNTTPKATGSTGTVVVTSTGSATGQILLAAPFALRPAAAAGGTADAGVVDQFGYAADLARPVAAGWL